MNGEPVMGWLGGGMGGGEILVVLAVALLFFGSKNLPKIARSLGRAMEEFRRATRQVTTEIMREEEVPPPAPEPRPPPTGEPKESEHDPRA